MNLKIRKATKKDIKEIVEIYSQGLLIENKLQNPDLGSEHIEKEIMSYENALKDYFTSKLNDKNAGLFVAQIDSQIVGFCELEYKKEQAIKPGVIGTIGEVAKLYVSPKYHRQGIATRLLEFSLNELKSNCDIARCELYARNIPSLKLHEKFGFKTYGYRMELDFNEQLS